VGLTLQRTSREFAGVAHGLHRFRSVWVGNGDTAAGEPIGAARAHSCSATIRKRVGLTLQRTSREFAGMTHLVSCKTSAQQEHEEGQREAQNSNEPM
jgi:hypothetical protein